MNLPLHLDPTIFFAGMAYLLLFRLGVLFIGGLSIYFGYRLFIQPLWTDKNQTTEVEAKFGKQVLILRNIAPGLFFVFFGMVMVVFVLANATPEITLEQERTAQGEESTVVAMRGADEALPAVLAETHKAFLDNQQQAQRLAEHALSQAQTPKEKAEVLTILASLAFLRGDALRAVAYQEQAVTELPDNSVLQQRLQALMLARQ